MLINLFVWTGVEFKRWLPYVVNGKIKLACTEYAMLFLGEVGFVAPGTNIPIIEGCLTSRLTASTGYQCTAVWTL